MNFESEPEDRHALIDEVEDDGERYPHKGKHNLANVSFNFINSIIGSGIIGMPYAIKKAGLGLGVILILVVAIISDYSLVLLVKGGQLSGTNNYQDLVMSSFGKIGYYTLSLIQFVYPFIVSQDNILANRYFIIFLSSTIITLPLSLSKDIGKLAKISLASLCCVFFLLLVIICRAFTLSPSIPPTTDAWIFANNGIIEAIGIMVFAFMCHHNSFLLYDSLDNPTQTRWNTVTHVSVVISAIATLSFGVIGYVIFTGYTEGDVLENFCKDDDLINVTRFVYTITIMMTYPIECFVCREVVDKIFYYNHPENLKRHFGITVVIVLAAMLISYATDCLGVVLEINGVITATPLAFIIPAMCYLRLSHRAHKLNAKGVGHTADAHMISAIPFQTLDNWGFSKRESLAAWGTLIFGLTILVVGTISILIHVSKGVVCSHGHELFYCLKNHTVVKTLTTHWHIKGD